jgi:pyruvate dehydrogenase E2 component (dihydrolipoamide acetyltransferase)
MIEEVPINSEETVEPQGTVEPPETVEPPADVPAPKKRGRPVGAKGKPKVKRAEPAPEPEPEPEPESAPEPKPKKTAPKKAVPKKAVPKKKPVVQSSDSEEETEKRAGTDARAVAFEVMQLLSNQHASRVAARRQKYAGWFQN